MARAKLNKFDLNDTADERLGERFKTKSRGMRTVMDDRLIRCEVYNPMSVEVIFTLQTQMVPYILAAGITPGPHMVICKPDDFANLNHAFYIMNSKDGRPCAGLVWNTGNLIGKGNKLPTRPAGM